MKVVFCQFYGYQAWLQASATAAPLLWRDSAGCRCLSRTPRPTGPTITADQPEDPRRPPRPVSTSSHPSHPHSGSHRVYDRRPARQWGAVDCRMQQPLSPSVKVAHMITALAGAQPDPAALRALG